MAIVSCFLCPILLYAYVLCFLATAVLTPLSEIWSQGERYFAVERTFIEKTRAGGKKEETVGTVLLQSSRLSFVLFLHRSVMPFGREGGEGGVCSKRFPISFVGLSP